MDINWSTFKAIVDSQSLAFRYVVVDNIYYLYVNDNNVVFTCTVPITDPVNPDQYDFETNLKSKGNRSVAIKTQPFADKVLPNGKKLFTRVHGISAQVSGAPDNITFTVPYAACKLTGLEIIGGLTGDKVNLKILDSNTGTYTGVANQQLNQFGFDVNVAKDFYNRESSYDADLFLNMQVQIEYDSVATLPADVYINLILHEVKD